MTLFELTFPALAVVAVGVATFGIARIKAPITRTRVRHAPPLLMLPGHPEAAWRLAPVHLSALIVRYQEADGGLTERVVYPKTIRGERVGSDRVRPNVVNAFCEADQGMLALRFERILSAADLRTGEFIDDLYAYFGGAQTGGAPARAYPADG